MESHYFSFFADSPASERNIRKSGDDGMIGLEETEIVTSIKKVLSLYLKNGNEEYVQRDSLGSRIMSKLYAPLPNRVYGLIYTKAQAYVSDGTLPFTVWDYVIFIADTNKQDDVKISYKYDAQLRLSSAYKLLYYLAEHQTHHHNFDECVDEFAQTYI